MKKIYLIIGFIVVVPALIVVYFLSAKNKAAKDNSVTIGSYNIQFQEGWESDIVHNSIIDTDVGGVYCLMEPKQDQAKEPCSYVYIHPKNITDFKLAITDTDQIPLGGGGFVSSITEKVDLGQGEYRGTFNFVWRGFYENPDDPNDQGTKTLDENGKPVLYFVWGCLKEDLCISHTSRKVSDNWQDAESFKDFVNSLIIKPNNL